MPDGVVFLPSFQKAGEKLCDADRLQFYEAIISYGLRGETIDMSPTVEALFMLVQPNIDSSQRRYRAAKENGRKGGRPPKKRSEDLDDRQPQAQEEDGLPETYSPLPPDEFERQRQERLAMLGALTVQSMEEE